MFGANFLYNTFAEQNIKHSKRMLKLYDLESKINDLEFRIERHKVKAQYKPIPKWKRIVRIIIE